MDLKRVKFNKTELNGENLDIMVKKLVTTALKGGKNKRTCVDATNIDESRGFWNFQYLS